MICIKSIIYGLKPGVPKRWLLLVAAIVWTFAGSMLLMKGLGYTIRFSDLLAIRYIIAGIAGLLFFQLLFSKISLKHINRIRTLDIVKPCIFSFFNFRSYILMGGMITMGIMLRHFSFINKNLLYTFYVAMGIPLLMSAIRFYIAWGTYYSFLKSENIIPSAYKSKITDNV
jgi:hypothetical protein